MPGQNLDSHKINWGGKRHGSWTEIMENMYTLIYLQRPSNYNDDWDIHATPYRVMPWC